MKVAKQIVVGIIMQAIIMLMHFFIHIFDSNNDLQNIHIILSFMVVIVITYLATFIFKLSLYIPFIVQLVTVLFVLIFENEGVYLLYYLHAGHSQWFNPDIYTDSVIIALEMLFIQFFSWSLAKLTLYLVDKVQTKS